MSIFFLINLFWGFSLDAWLDEALFEGGVESSTHGHISNSTDSGVAFEALQAGGAASAHEARSACRHQTGTHVRHRLSLLLTLLHLYISTSEL